MKFLNLGQKSQGIRSAVLLQVVAKYSNVIIQLIITMILARLLTPEEYGVVAVVSVLIGLFGILSNVGISPAIIQYRELTEENCSSLFSFTLLLGLVFSVFFCVLSVPVSWFYANEQYISLLAVGSLSVFFNAANMVPNGILIRDKKFLALGIRTISVTFFCGIICIALACLGWGSFALVFNTVLTSFFLLIWNIALSKLKFGNWNFVEPLRIVSKFSTYQFSAQLMQYFARNMDTLLIGMVFGSTALGFYDKAYKLAKYPVDLVPVTINPVLKTFFSGVGNDYQKLYYSYFKVQKTLSIFSIFAALVCFFCSEELITLFFGDQWENSIVYFKILSLSIPFQIMVSTVFAVLEASKRTDFLMRCITTSSLGMLVFLSVGLLSSDLVVVSVCVVLGFVFNFVVVVYYVIYRLFNRSVIKYIRLFVPEIVAGLLVGLGLYMIQDISSVSLFASLAIKLIFGLFAYAALLYPMKQLRYVKQIFRKS